MNIVSIGGGNGQGQVAKAVMRAVDMSPSIRGSRVTFITTAFDDGYSTGVLRKRENDAGYYGDVTRVLDALRRAGHGESDWLYRKSAVRFERGIPAGQRFGDIFADQFGGTFGQKGMRGPYRSQAIQSISTALRLDQISDVTIKRLIFEAFDFPVEEDCYPYHSLRNLFLFTLERVAKRWSLPFSKALEAMHAFYGIPANYRVIPVTWEAGILKARTRLGNSIDSQFLIDFRTHDPSFRRFDEIKTLWIDPPVSPAPEVLRAIAEADVVILPCGSLMGNVVAPFLVGNGELKEALWQRSQQASLSVVYVMNLMTSMGETQFDIPYTAVDIVELVGVAVGLRPTCIICDKTEIPADVLRQLLPEKKIKLGGLKPYVTSSRFERPSLIKEEIALVVSGDASGLLPKIVHDPEKLARVFTRIFSEVPVGAPC